MSQSANLPPLGAQDLTSSGSATNALDFLVREILSEVDTASLVQVLSATSAGGLAPAGRLSVQPLVNQLGGYGNNVPQGPLYDLIYLRMQGGANAVIMDPAVGDIGIAVFANRDISSVKSTRGQANPGSRRQFSMSDGMYLGGVLNGTPTQFVQFNAAGITVTSPTAVVIAVGSKTWRFDDTGLTLSNGLLVEPHTHPYLPGPGPTTETGTMQS